jgi:hypothetical protein
MLAICLVLTATLAGAAQVTVQAAYADGAVSITGDGFVPDSRYLVRVVDTANNEAKAVGNARSNEDGRIQTELTTGLLNQSASFKVFVTDDKGESQAEAELQFAGEQTAPPATDPPATPTPSPTAAPGGGTVTPTPGAPTDPPADVITLKPELEGERASAAVDKQQLDAAFAQAEENDKGIKLVTLELEGIAGATEYVQKLPASFFLGTEKQISRKLEIQSVLGTIVVPDLMLGKEKLTQEDDIFISIGTADLSQQNDALRARIGNRPVVELHVQINGVRTAWKNSKAPVTIALPYVPTNEELQNPEHIVVWYIDSKGKAIPVKNGRYDTATGTVQFQTTHFSLYAVAYVQKTFEDTGKQQWAERAIEVLASKGIINGVSETNFVPQANITRADFLKLLVESLDLSADFTENFNDVLPADYYYEAAGIAKALGISEGTGSGLFEPKSSITRQDMMVMAAKAMLHAGKELPSANTDQLAVFADRSQVADYATDSLGALYAEGIIQGSGNYILAKKASTRAEAAVIIYRIYNH